MRTFAAFLVLASPLLAQAPRAVVDATVGKAKLTIEHGCPPWSESRKAQLDQMLPVGTSWRLGADTRTTFVVGDGDILLGDTVIEGGGYGLNLLRVADKQWAFVVYDGSDTTPAPEDQVWHCAATLVEKTDAAPERLVVTLAGSATGGKLVVRFGPLEVSASVAPLDAVEKEIELGGEQTNARWWSRPAGAALAKGAFALAGRISSFWVDEVDCAMDVELLLGDAAATVRFTNRELAKAQAKLARATTDLDTMKKNAEAGGPIARRFQAGLKDAEEKKVTAEQELAELDASPKPCEFTVPLAAAKKASGHLGAQLLRKDGKLTLVVDADARAGSLVVDEKRLLPEKAVRK